MMIKNFLDCGSGSAIEQCTDWACHSSWLHLRSGAGFDISNGSSLFVHCDKQIFSLRSGVTACFRISPCLTDPPSIGYKKKTQPSARSTSWL
uniref:Uncharacterized protein n=1 Tax=Romanomermis culicivorax TaxID=13658 RepID=A0A915I0E4_ROMCU